MGDPIFTSLTTSVISILAPYLTKGAEEFINTAGKDAYEKAKGLFAFLKKRWMNNREASDALVRFEEKPDRYKPVLEDILNENLAKEKSLYDELSIIMKKMGPTLIVIQEIQEADEVVGLVSHTSSTSKAAIRQKIGKAKTVIGAEFDSQG